MIKLVFINVIFKSKTGWKGEYMTATI